MWYNTKPWQDLFWNNKYRSSHQFKLIFLQKSVVIGMIRGIKSLSYEKSLTWSSKIQLGMDMIDVFNYKEA